MSGLRQAVDEYLKLRRSLGFRLGKEGRLLPQFIAYLERQGAAFITARMAYDWATLPSGTAAKWQARRLGAVRGFATYVRAIDPRTEIPGSDLIPYRKVRTTPYLYSGEDIQVLMMATRGLQNALRAATYHTLIGLLATTGMRVGEAIRLDRADVDWLQGLLVVRDSKFRKSRQIPLHRTTVEALRNYAQKRDRFFPRPQQAWFFSSQRGSRIGYNNVAATFRHLVRETGLADRPPRRPRLHDLRHSFAVRTLTEWYRAGDQVQAKLPVLSTYLGHVDPSTTYWYLTATIELLGLAAQRLERAWGELP